MSESQKKDGRTKKRKPQPEREQVSEEEAAAEQAGEAELRGTEEAEEAVVEGIDELRDQLQRLAADYQNYQKRSQRQVEQAGQFARETLVKSLLSVLDNFEHALAKGGEAQDAEAVLEGVRIVYDHLASVLEGVGMRRIEVEEGTAFDPSLHEAMLHEESGTVEANCVVRELAAGYVMNGRTLRPAKVSVAKAPSAPAGGDESEGMAGRDRQDDSD